MNNHLNSSQVAPLHPDNATIDRLNELITRTNAKDPDPGDLRALKTLVAQYPIIYRDFGDLGRLVHTRIANAIHGQPLVRESILLTADELRAQLTDPTDTPLQKLLVEQCITTYLLHTATEMRYVHEGFKSYTTPWDDRLEASQKRFLRALETLTRLRQTPTAPMQINIAGTQTNIVTPTADSENP